MANDSSFTHEKIPNTYGKPPINLGCLPIYASIVPFASSVNINLNPYNYKFFNEYPQNLSKTNSIKAIDRKISFRNKYYGLTFITSLAIRLFVDDARFSDANLKLNLKTHRDWFYDENFKNQGTDD